jgi:hypothetical protein
MRLNYQTLPPLARQLEDAKDKSSEAAASLLRYLDVDAPENNLLFPLRTSDLHQMEARALTAEMAAKTLALQAHMIKDAIRQAQEELQS